jgi:hypothetical protein
MSEYHLIVREPWGDYARGDHIADAATVTEILAGERRTHVVRIAPLTTTPPAAPAEGH